MSSDSVIRPRFLTKERMCEYLAITTATYDKYQRQGIVPGPVPGTNRYCIKHHDFWIDEKLGIRRHTRRLSPLEEWELAHE